MKTNKILFIDPDRSIFESVNEYLATGNYKIKWVQTATDAVTAADKNNYNCVVVELALAAHSGIEFIHEFRSYTDFAGTPIIVFTNQHITDLGVLKNIKVNAYLYKPQTSLAQLKAVIDEQVQ